MQVMLEACYILAKKPLTNSLVPSALTWWAEVGNIWRITDCISGFRKATNIGQELAGNTSIHEYNYPKIAILATTV